MLICQNPPLFLHITSTSKDGLEKAIEKIEELMKQELPNLVDERRFRKREPDVERDEFGRVSRLKFVFDNADILCSENGPRPRYLLTWRTFQVSTFERRLLVKVALTSSIYNRKLDVVSR